MSRLNSDYTVSDEMRMLEFSKSPDSLQLWTSEPLKPASALGFTLFWLWGDGGSRPARRAGVTAASCGLMGYVTENEDDHLFHCQFERVSKCDELAQAGGFVCSLRTRESVAINKGFLGVTLEGFKVIGDFLA